MSAGALADRAREVRARAAIRAWEYRQRHLAKGVWTRLTRLLAGAESAWAIPPEAAVALEVEGFTLAPVGAELQPPRVILLAPADRIARVSGARRLEVRLSAELLSEQYLALVPFAGDETLGGRA